MEIENKVDNWRLAHDDPRIKRKLGMLYQMVDDFFEDAEVLLTIIRNLILRSSLFKNLKRNILLMWDLLFLLVLASWNFVTINFSSR
jgi:hypothetical protein